MVFGFGDVFGDDFVTADSNPMSKTTRNSRKQPKTTNKRPTTLRMPNESFLKNLPDDEHCDGALLWQHKRSPVLPQEDLRVIARGYFGG